MIVTPELYDRLLLRPYGDGQRHLRVITGYASAAFLQHVANILPNASIEIIVGMAGKDGIRRWDHSEFLRLSRTSENRIHVLYHVGEQPIHSKCVAWENNQGVPQMAFSGSANFSWNGYRNYHETMVSLPVPGVVSQIFQVAETINCLDAHATESIQLLEMPKFVTNARSLGELAEFSPSVNLDLFHRRQGIPTVHERSGLNWGQREEYRREPNQAYIPVPIEVHRLHPGFFPPSRHEFMIVTDDGQSFVAVMAQQNRKAIETHYDNSILGRYFRDRLQIRKGAPVRYEDLENYGRTSVTLYRLEEDLYFLDFSI